MEFKEVNPYEILVQQKQAAAKAQPKAAEIDVKTFKVVDPDTDEVVGYIDAPIDYCDLLECPHKTGLKHPMGFINPLDPKMDQRELWVHAACMKPTRAWWAGQWKSMVYGGKQMPWDDNGS